MKQSIFKFHIILLFFLSLFCNTYSQNTNKVQQSSNRKIRISDSLLIVSSSNEDSVQKTEIFDNKIQQLPNNKVKIYLNKLFRITSKECSKYYIITEFERNNYRFKDSIKCFYTANNNLYLLGKFNKGKLHGEFKLYSKNKQLEMTFGYNYGIRKGVWKKFNEKGELEKKVFYKNGNEYLIDFYDYERNLIVKNGNGKYEELLNRSISATYKIKVKGQVKNGLPDGVWSYYLDNNIISKEYFKNFVFEKGISFSKKLGETEYYDHFNATFIDRVLIENLKIRNGYDCREINKITLGTKFYDKLEKVFYKNGLDKIIKNDWFLIDVSTGKNRKIKNVNIISNSSKKNIDLIKNMILKLKNPLSRSRLAHIYNYKSDFMFFAIVIKNSKLYNKFDNGDIELLKFKY